MTDRTAATALDLALDAARAGGDELQRRFRRSAEGVSTKSSPTDLVSDADRAAEVAILDVIRMAYPDDAVVAEESGRSDGTSGYRWIVDPLDGTVNYLYGLPMWCVAISLDAPDGRRLAAVVHAPALEETYLALAGGGATCNGERLHVSDKVELATALVATGFHYDADRRAAQGAVAATMLRHVRDLRRLGSCAYDLCLVAAGRIDAFYEAPVEIWDRAAGELLVTEAGGRVSPLDVPGMPGRSGVVATNAHLHATVAKLVTAHDN